ncbi:putative transmembrane protein TauE [Lupinus albus]|uniref:Putative transmembrane protein TauE n=1 Tax=Lupinus albus TaxID=3870 RepID=A0A6A4PFW1_LUPAL|nr:putative transmembrane protein TauE [Lupinus albus]
MVWPIIVSVLGMLTGAAISTVIFNWKLKHPTLDIPIIEYDLVLLMQPILMLGISIGVSLSVIFADWMVTVLLIILFIVTSIKACFKGLETWKKETILKEESVKLLESTATCSGEGDYKSLPDSLDGGTQKETTKPEGTFLGFRHWKELGLLSFVWLAHLAIQIAKIHTASCSITYWILNVLQIPVSLGVFLYQAIGLHQGWRVISSKGDQGTHLPLYHLILASLCGLLAGTIGGLLGIGTGFVMGPLFLELGIAPQVASATATFGMTFSASISVVQYYLLNRFPVPYALYLTFVAAIAAYIGQHIINKLVNLFGRASLIIFVLAFTIFVSTIALGGVGISDMIGKIKRNEYMGFEDLCNYDT